MKYRDEPEIIGICAGSVDEESVGTQRLQKIVKGKTKHIFVDEKAGWYALGEDGLDRYERFSDGK